jgi:hypothetical protein
MRSGMFVLGALATASSALASAPAIAPITMGALEPNVVFGGLINAPNGHISFLKSPDGYRIWLPGRDVQGSLNEEGGFLYQVPSWSLADLAAGVPNFCFGPTSPAVGTSFDRDYAALNAVVPGSGRNTLLGFYDAEYHPLSTPGNKQGQPLLSSIGLAISTDDGVTWEKAGQVIVGLDEALLGFDAVVSDLTALAMTPAQVDDGASSPSAVVREDHGERYIYLYYDDRTNFAIPGLAYSIYVARARLVTDGLPGNWQKWTGTDWGLVGDQTVAVPVMVPPIGSAQAMMPHVSYNTTLRCWLMAFKTRDDFELATSDDGVHWNPPISIVNIKTQLPKGETGFPTLISPGSGEDGPEHPFFADDARRPGVCIEEGQSQQTTGATGWLFFSNHAAGDPQYLGYRIPFTISAPPHGSFEQ